MKPNQPDRQKMVQEAWYSFLTQGYSLEEFRYRRLFSRLPSNPRYRICNAPFKGIGARILRMSIDLRQSALNPNLCNSCEKFAAEYQGGAEVDLTLLFADVRGSTTLAESMSALQSGTHLDPPGDRDLQRSGLRWLGRLERWHGRNCRAG